LTIFPLPTLNIPRIDSICIGETYQINADSTLFYAWDPSLTLTPTNVHNPLLNPLVNTKYMVTLRDSNFCVNRDSFTLFVLLLPNANIANLPAILCRGDNLSLNASGGGTYLWTPGNPLNDSISANPSLILTDSTKYILEVTSALGCKNYDTIQLNVQQLIVATTSADTAICKGTQIQIFSLGGLYYSWSPNAFIAGSNLQQNPFVTPDSTIQYIVNVSNDCFSDTAIVNININPLPLANAGPDQTIYRNTSATLDASGTGDFIWYPATNLSNPYSEITVASPLETTSYLLIVTDANGCINYDTVKVEVIGNTLLLLPTAFSPNGDGVNDVFRISKWLNIEKLESFNIYNRWGELVFNTLDIDAGWDGTYKNYPQPTSSFDWVVKAKDYDGNIIIKSGIVTLIR
jgi:gliding motility-associated-like protein